MAVSAPTELWQVGALELTRIVRSKRASSREIVQAHLDRIGTVDPAVNAVPVRLAEEALRAALDCDRAVAGGDTLGPLHGVPFLVKSNIDVRGLATTQGMRALADAYPEQDAPTVERMKGAGAIVLGHTNMPNGAVRWHCVSELYGATVNPWNSSRTAGGSSAAVAAAIAAGMSPLGLGNDGLGSLRHPAQCCGIAALKPTIGRIPDASTASRVDIGGIGPQLLTVNGPMARGIPDLRATLEVIAGATWRDPWSVPAPLQGPRLRPPLRVALVVDPAGLGVARQVELGVRKAGQALTEAGYIVDELEPPSIDLAAETCLAMLNTPDIRRFWKASREMAPADTASFLDQFYAAAGEPDPVATLSAFKTRHQLLRQWSEFLQTFALIAAPICTEPPFVAGTDLGEGRVAAEIASMRMTTAVNALGLPSVAVPVGVEDGLPQAVQLISARYREDLCLDAAQALEDAFGTFTPIDPKA